MSDNALNGLTCPRCGGTITVPEGLNLVICPFCELRSAVSGERGVRRYQVPQRISYEQAQGVLATFLSSDMSIAPSARSAAKLSETFLVHLPFWTAWGQGVAWAFGQQRVGSGDDERYEPREKSTAREMSWNGVACDVGEFGVRRISLENRPLEPFNSDGLHRSGMVFEPVGSEQAALEAARQSFEASVAKDVKLTRTSQLFTRLLGARLGLVYYPVWVLRYLFKGRSFQVVVDGFSGEVLYGKAPGNVLYRALTLVGGMALGAFLAVDVSTLILSAAEDETAAFALGSLAVGLGIMYAAFRKFRYGEHHEYHRYKESQALPMLNFGGDEDVVSQLVDKIGKL
ncbi:MAG: hypothetical protein JW987_15835 [Anaerolineaceae bacterium]|nr:hypothetical protein [Anaerolineaceae bacterium]